MSYQSYEKKNYMAAKYKRRKKARELKKNECI